MNTKYLQHITTVQNVKLTQIIKLHFHRVFPIIQIYNAKCALQMRAENDMSTNK